MPCGAPEPGRKNSFCDLKRMKIAGRRRQCEPNGQGPRYCARPTSTAPQQEAAYWSPEDQSHLADGRCPRVSKTGAATCTPTKGVTGDPTWAVAKGSGTMLAVRAQRADFATTGAKLAGRGGRAASGWDVHAC